MTIGIRVVSRGDFFADVEIFILAPSRCPTKLQQQMAASMEELSKQFEIFELMM